MKTGIACLTQGITEQAAVERLDGDASRTGRCLLSPALILHQNVVEERGKTLSGWCCWWRLGRLVGFAGCDCGLCVFTGGATYFEQAKPDDGRNDFAIYLLS
ncbi:MAG: hypothetical protein JWR26_3037 [Pedosphaera sp.]|nr:hypothetical protein [Pedosphaera sp.]